MNDIPYLERRTRRDGSSYWVVNPTPKVRELLHVRFESGFPGYEEAAARAKELHAAFRAYRRTGEFAPLEGPITVAALWQWYQGRPEFRRLKPQSQRSYRILGESMLREFGRVHARSLTRDAVVLGLYRIEKAASYHRAFHVAKLLRRIFTVGHDKVGGWNPARSLGLSAPAARSILWTRDGLERFCAVAQAAGRPSLARLAWGCYDLAQRPSDIRSLHLSQLQEGGVFHIVQQKTGAEVWPTASPRFLAMLDEIPPEHGGWVCVNERTGERWGPDSYDDHVRELLRRAGLPQHWQIRDLRRTAGTEMADAGATDREIMAVTGHKNTRTIATYAQLSAQTASRAAAKRWAED